MNKSILTQEEIELIRNLYKDNSKQKDIDIDKDTKETLLKIGNILPISNRGGTGRNIIKIINDLG